MPTNTNNDRTPVAVITGGTKGLGRAFAELFAGQGFDICVCARTAIDLGAMKTAWAEEFPQRRLFAFQADLGKKSGVLHFADFVRTHFSRLDVLINNAGLFIPGAILEEPDGALEHTMNINLYSAYHLTRALMPLILPYRHGHIFNLCSIASIAAYPNGGSYTISKFALLGFSKVLREEMKTAGIKVTALLPGATWSDSWQGADYPTDRLMQASDIAKMVWAAYTLSDSAVVEELLIRPQLGDL